MEWYVYHQEEKLNNINFILIDQFAWGYDAYLCGWGHTGSSTTYGGNRSLSGGSSTKILMKK